MLTVVTPADNADLIDLNSIKSELKIKTGAEDDNLSRWISQASTVIAKHCNRIFARETVTETFRIRYPQDAILLARFPVSEISSVIENDSTLTSDDFEVDENSGILRRLGFSFERCWPTGKIVVTYTAGYQLPGDLPEDVQRAAVCLVGHYRSSAGRPSFLRSEDIPGVGSFSYQDLPTDFDLPPEVRGLLDHFRIPAGS